MKMRIVTFLLATSIAASAADKLPLLPYPKRIEQKEHDWFSVSRGTKIILSPKTAKADRIPAEMLAEEIMAEGSVKVPIAIGGSAEKSIVLRRLDSKDFPKLEGNDADRFKAEGY